MDPESRPTGTVAFLFTDIEGSTEAWEATSDAMGAAVARLEDLLDDAATRGRRAVEQGAGDSAVLAFDRASDAAAAALAIQQAVAHEPWPTARPLRLRVALHLGEVETGRDGTYRGATMNRCGRLLATAHGGQVVASGSFRSVLEESDGSADGALAEASWIDLGSHRLRDIEVPMRIWQMSHSELETQFPPLRTPEGMGLHLPGKPSPLIGRAGDLERLGDLVEVSRVVTVLGSGGSGKTRLAVELAHRAIDDFDDVAWVDLAKVADGGGVDPLVVAELSLHHGAPDLRRRIVDHLRARRALIVLDNCEHVLAPTASLVDDLVKVSPALRVVATSREPLEVSGEAILRLGPLGVPVERDGSDLLSSDAGALFAERVSRVRPGRPLAGDDLTAAGEICRRLDGIPLALELAAARARSMPIAVVADRLEQRFALLIGGSRTAMARQRTLEASVGWSYDLLDGAEQAALRHLATFSGPFDLAAASAVIDVDDADPTDLVASLVDKSLLLEEPADDVVRFRMLETVRFYARDRSVQAGDATASRDRHLDWARSEVVALAASFEGSHSADALRRTDRIIDEIRVALEWALSVGRQVDVLTTASALGWYWVWRGCASEGGEWLDRAEATLSGDDEVDSQLAARVGFARHLVVTHRRPEHTEVERVTVAAIDAAVAAGDLGLEARCRLQLATHHCFRDPVKHGPEQAAAAAMCHEHGGPFWSARADADLAQCALFRVHLREAIELVEPAERAARLLGNHQLAAESLSRRCAIAEGLGDYDGVLAAAADLDGALDGVTIRAVRGIALRSVAIVDLHRGDVEGVIGRMRQTFDDYLRDEDRQFLPLFVGPLAAALTEAGRIDEAVALLGEVYAHPGVRAARVYETVLAAAFASTLWCAGERDRARAVVDDALGVADLLESPVFEAQLVYTLGGFDLDDKDPSPAETRLHHALDVLHEHGHRQQVCDVLEELARLELDFARPATAAVLLGGASRERDAQGVVLRPWRQATYLATLDRTRTELGDAGFDDRWARGRALDLDEVVAHAQRGRGERTRPTFGWDGLTDTERRVAELAAEGLTNPQIADRLVVGKETVKSHMAAILRKLALENRTQLARAVPPPAEPPPRRGRQPT